MFSAVYPIHKAILVIPYKEITSNFNYRCNRKVMPFCLPVWATAVHDIAKNFPIKKNRKQPVSTKLTMLEKHTITNCIYNSNSGDDLVKNKWPEGVKFMEEKWGSVVEMCIHFYENKHVCCCLIHHHWYHVCNKCRKNI